MLLIIILNNYNARLLVIKDWYEYNLHVEYNIIIINDRKEHDYNNHRDEHIQILMKF